MSMAVKTKPALHSIGLVCLSGLLSFNIILSLKNKTTWFFNLSTKGVAGGLSHTR
jgi:hypothetical protein